MRVALISNVKSSTHPDIRFELSWFEFQGHQVTMGGGGQALILLINTVTHVVGII